MPSDPRPRFEPSDLIGGVDTHTDTHTLAILSATGSIVFTETFSADDSGYRQMVEVLHAAGHVTVIGVEGTDSYGSGLTRVLIAAGFVVKEVLRPARQVRRLRGKSDPIDAVEAARAVMSGNAVSDPKDTTTPAESLRFLLAARAQLIAAQTALANTITSLLVTAPEPLRAKYRGTPARRLIKRLADSRPYGELSSPHTSAAIALRQLAITSRDLDRRATDLEARMRSILEDHYPQMLAIYGSGAIVASQLVVTAGGNPDRIRNEAAFAALCGAAPIPASSGRTTRHRLNRGGDRRGNAALHRIALVRMRYDERTRNYVARRKAEGKSPKETLRCLKRAIAREVFRALTGQVDPPVIDLRALRQSRGLTLTAVAAALNTKPARISDIETHRRPLPELTTRYQAWLTAA